MHVKKSLWQKEEAMTKKEIDNAVTVEEELTEDQARDFLAGQRDFIKTQFERFGFNQTLDSKDRWVKWEHEGENDESTIIIDMITNSMRVSQQQKQEDGTWRQVMFSAMAPLPELMMDARDVYLVSLKTRGLNKQWDMSKTNIIPGTNGDGK